MKTNTLIQSVQAHCKEWTEALDRDPVMRSLTSAQDLERYMQEGFGRMLHALMNKERSDYLDVNLEDRANGFAPQRTFRVGTVPVEIQRPRTRMDFYPECLPKYQRHLPESYQQMLGQILLDSRSFQSAWRTMGAMGLGMSPQELEAVLKEMEQEAKEFHGRPLSSDWLALYIDAKVIDMKNEQHQVQKAVHFLVAGVDLEARKQVLCSRVFWGQEAIDCWRQVLLEIKNRGVTRVLLLVTDDFSGLAPLVKSLLPSADHQLCTVHLLRNAHRHLSKDDYALFIQNWQEICACSNLETARAKWLSLMEKLRADYKSWVQHLEPRTDNILAFMNYPRPVRRNIRTTNVPEGLNNLIEQLSRNSGGHFHSEREVKIKMKILIDRLLQGKWAKPHIILRSYLHPLTQMFRHRFETEPNPQPNNLTQHI